MGLVEQVLEERGSVKLRLVVCCKCFNVKAVLPNMIGTSAYCEACKEMTPHFNSNDFITLVTVQKMKIPR